MSLDEASREAREKFLALGEALRERRERDPLLTYPLHDKQRQFVQAALGTEVRETWFIAANRSGKSDAGAYIGASLARFGTPEIREARAAGSDIVVRDRATSGWVSALDFPTARDVIQPKYFDNGYGLKGGPHGPFIPKHEIEDWNSTNQVLRLKNGSLIGFKSADSGRKKYQGAEKDWFHMDEEHPWDIYEESVIRVGQRPLRFFCTATILPPEGQTGSPSWVFPKIIQPFLEGRLKHAKVFGASIYDNPGIPPDEIRRLESIYPEGSTSRRIRLEGEWLPGIGGARAYPSFDRQLHVMRRPYDINPRRPLVWTWDFNVEPMSSLVGQTDGINYYIVRELILDEGNIKDVCQLFYDRFPRHQAEIWLYGDATSNRRTGQTGKSDYWTILNEMKGYGPIRLRVPQENPKVPDRVNAVNRICLDEDGQVRLQIDPSCQELIADMEGVLRDTRGGILKTHNRKDPYFRRTHSSDALGYWLAYEEPVRPPTARSREGILDSLKAPSYGFGGHR